ncbi:MucR family transcriptional regulator, partial [Methylobacterium oryzisoli]|uniref:MucR family transcriptional regulator n=1 Tax=Methylobacterium oryzisoli TaxID=3385502 RepID=UPI00397A7C95
MMTEVEGHDEDAGGLVALTADIVSAYVSKNSVPVAELPGLLSAVHGTLESLVSPPPPEPEKPVPPVPVKRTVTPDHIISLE